MCDTQSPARANLPSSDSPEGSSYHAGFRSAAPAGTGAASATPTLNGWPRQISWNEFGERASRPRGVEEDAQIDYRMSLAYNWTTAGGQALLDSITIQLWIDFDNSWYVTGQNDATLLEHEQAHYDIAGLCYKQMGRQLSALRANTGRALKRQLNRIKRNANRTARRINRLYDRDTDHGTRTARQQAWENHIRDCIRNNRTLRGAPP